MPQKIGPTAANPSGRLPAPTSQFGEDRAFGALPPVGVQLS